VRLSINKYFRKYGVAAYSKSMFQALVRYDTRTFEQAVDAMCEQSGLLGTCLTTRRAFGDATETEARVNTLVVHARIERASWSRRRVWFLDLGHGSRLSTRAAPRLRDIPSRESTRSMFIVAAMRDGGVPAINAQPVAHFYGSTSDKPYWEVASAFDEAGAYLAERAEFFNAFRHSA
jgi:hypothetical protein